ncbi:hypothetical protein [Albimonas pacifica]|uniref:Right handed beta helix region n=1 Tax=Albimonas pacifica TaxID=1114924 RepID=A0A1I3PRL0_9RHOB|nr:hypothetical protein [Albimonas pacifica]SFJ24123.1 hypothetical protein SAMN05216258_1205 [Albimonas pacifica]
MLTLLAVFPALAATRALADGTSGTLGSGTVGPSELRPGAVSLDKISNLSGARVLGRGLSEGGGVPRELTPADLRRLIDSAESALVSSDRLEAESLSPPAQVQGLFVQGYAVGGDGGAAFYRRSPVEPPHPGKFSTADGGWWELTTLVPQPEMFGALADGVSDDAWSINDALAFADTIELTGEYGVSAPVVLKQGQSLRGLNPVRSGLNLRAANAQVMTDPDASAYSVTLEGLYIDGRNVAETALRFQDNNNNNSGLRNLRIRNFLELGLTIGANSDQLVMDRVDIGPSRAGSPTSVSLRHVGPGPFYATNCSLTSGAGIGLYSSSHCTLVNTRINFFVNGLVRFEPRTRNTFMNLVGPFLENTGFAHAADGVPAGAPVGVLCDGVDDPSGTTSGGIIIESPQKVQAGWASTLFKAANGGMISVDCRLPWEGNTANRDLLAMDVGGTDSGSFIELRGPWSFVDWDEVTTLLRASPQGQGFPVRVDGGNGQHVMWSADFSSAAGWTAAGAASGVTTTAQGLRFNCTGPSAYVRFVLPASVMDRCVGHAVLLRVETSAAGSGPMSKCILLTGAGLTKTAASRAWTAANGYGRRAFHCAMGYVNAAGEAEVRIFGNNDGSVASSAQVTVHSAQLIGFGMDGPLAA